MESKLRLISFRREFIMRAYIHLVKKFLLSIFILAESRTNYWGGRFKKNCSDVLNVQSSYTKLKNSLSKGINSIYWEDEF